MTWPLENGGEMTVNHHRHTPYIQQAQILYKAGILGYDTCSILRTVVRIGLPAIAMRRDERMARDEGIIKLMLYFFRNIAGISPIPNLPTQGLEKEVSRSATIEAFRQQDVFALLLTICSNMGEDFDSQDVIILEILFNLIKGVEVEKLWMTEDQRKSRETNDLKNVMREETGLHRDVKKSAASRHGRFGTMIWVKREDDKVSTVSGQDNLRDGHTTFLNMDKSKKWNKPQQRRKDIQHTIQDFDKTVRLTASASELLRNFAEEFLDSSFNPLITHLRKAIEREAERVLDINYRQFFYVVAWFLQAERARRERQKKDHQRAKVQADFEAESFGLVAGVLNQETFITLNRYMQQSFDNKEWQDLNASMRCFTQILLTVQEMTQSPLEDDQEIADNIQNRIFYEETTHDRIVSILRGYKDQGFGYLDACTELSHVFLRMLERYSKENADLQIRSRRRARRKKKEDKKAAAEGAEEEDEDARSENEDVADVAQVSKERKFDFTRFAAKFTSQSSVDTYIAFTKFYRDLSVEQLKRAHRFFYRVAFKQELAVLMYRIDIIALFYKMIKGPEGLDISHAMYKDWSELVRQVLKRLFKKLDQRPELFVELLFSKINATLYYLEYGREKQTATSTRVPAELEVKPAPGRTVEDKIGIVIAALQQDDKSELVSWVKLALIKAVEERQGWEGEALARAEDAAQDEPPPEPPKPPYIGKQNFLERVNDIDPLSSCTSHKRRHRYCYLQER
jgi:replication fork protection complex subunit Tof1/Swi1